MRASRAPCFLITLKCTLVLRHAEIHVSSLWLSHPHHQNQKIRSLVQGLESEDEKCMRSFDTGNEVWSRGGHLRRRETTKVGERAQTGGRSGERVWERWSAQECTMREHTGTRGCRGVRALSLHFVAFCTRWIERERVCGTERRSRWTMVQCQLSDWRSEGGKKVSVISKKWENSWDFSKILS